MNSDGVLKSGRFGNWIYCVRNGKEHRRRYTKPRDPRTPEQLRLRAAFGAASKAYSQVLTEEQRRECRAAGAKVRSRPRLYQSGPLTGQQYCIQRKAAAARSEETPKARSRKARRPVQ
jgi:hypothetical protein